MQEQQQNKKTREEVPFWHLFLYAGFVLALWISAWVLSNIVLDDLAKRGQFGDSFGAVNALFSGLAFAVLIFTIRQQQLEIQQTQKLIEQQEAELKDQNKTLSKQRFENTFFQLVGWHQQNIGQITTYTNGRATEGRENFSRFYNKISNDFARVDINNFAACKQVYGEKFKAEYEAQLEKYFRTLSNILVFVDSDRMLSKDEKFFYINLLRSLCSKHELIILYYNSCFYKNESDFKNLLNKYSFFSGLYPRDLIAPEHQGFFLKQAASTEDTGLVFGKEKYI